MATNVSKPSTEWEYNPSTVSGLLMRVRPEELSAISEGAVVSTWTANAGLNLTGDVTSGLTVKTTNGQKGVDFAGATGNAFKSLNNLNSATATSFSMFAVSAMDSGTTNFWRGIYSTRFVDSAYGIGGQTGYHALGTNSSGQLYWEGTGLTIATFYPVGQGMQLYSGTATSGDRKLYRNGSLATSGTATNALSGTTNYTYLGAWADSAQVWNGQTAEVLFYSGVLSDTNRTSVEGYLANKHLLTSNLPSTHWYKSHKPLTKMLFWDSEIYSSAS